MAFDYKNIPKEYVRCNLCGGTSTYTLEQSSCNGLEAVTGMCRTCGLVYLNPRMTKEGYDLYYKYHYRQDRDHIKGTSTEVRLDKNFSDGKKFGNALAARLGQYFRPGLTIDVGSSTGGILTGLREKIPGLHVLGIEPSVAESDYANRQGIPTDTALLENWNPKGVGQASNILCVQSLNHLLDPAGFIRWAYDLLEPGGSIFLAVKNWRHQVRRAGSRVAGIQIDHPYMFTPETLTKLVEKAGFHISFLDVDESKNAGMLRAQREAGLSVHHIRIVGTKPFEATTKREQVYSPFVVWKLRLQLCRVAVYLYYLVHYSHRFSKVRNFLSFH